MLYFGIELVIDHQIVFVVWCGVVWCGVVWCGVVWCGVVWCGVVWCGVVWWCGQGVIRCALRRSVQSQEGGRRGR
jgi:hypothetical protein